MPNGFAMVQESIWRDPAFRALARPAQATYVQLLSQKELDRAGVIPYQPTKWVKGCNGMSFTDLVADLDELEVAGFVYRDEDTDEVLIRSYIRHNNVVKQPNILKNALKCARALASVSLRRVLAAELRRLGKAEATATADEIDPGDPTPPEGSRNPSGTHPEGFPNPSGGVEPFANPSRTPQVGVEVVGNRSVENYSSSSTSAKGENRDESPQCDECGKPMHGGHRHTRAPQRHPHHSEAATEFANGDPIPAEPPADAWTPPIHGANAIAPDRIENPRPTNVVPIGDGISTLVRLNVRTPLSHSERTKLEAQVQRLLRDPHVERRDVEAALADWDTRERAGIGLLPSLVTDATKRRLRAERKPAGVGKPTTKARGIQNATDQLIASMTQENPS